MKKLKTYLLKSTLVFICIFFVQHTYSSEYCSTYQNLGMAELPGSCDPEWSRDIDQCPDCFRPNFDFPRTLPPEESLPWTGIDFTTMSGAKAFLNAVLEYSLEGFDGDNLSKWNVFENKVRTWYHAPWLHPHDHDGSGKRIEETPDLRPGKKDYGPVRTGREYLLGLTEELQSGPHMLGINQKVEKTNWAVSFYNSRAAYSLWKVWNDGKTSPTIHLDATSFAAGSVFAKPLYTTVTAEEAPFLTGAPTARANVSTNRFEVWNREPTEVRLIQFDLAVKLDEETFKSLTGLENTYTWVYGTFVYDGRSNDQMDPWKRLRPVGLSWGSDPDVADCTNDTVAQSIVLLNANDLDIEIGDTAKRDWGRAQKKPCHESSFGREGRMNGPVDNPISSCHSCHSAAQYRKIAHKDTKTLKNRVPWPDPWPLCIGESCTQTAHEAFWSRDKCLFTNRSALTPLGDIDTTQPENCGISSELYVSTDTALQVSFGLLNFCRFLTEKKLTVQSAPTILSMALSCDQSLRYEPQIMAFDIAPDTEFLLQQLQATFDRIHARLPSTLVGKGGPTR